MKILSILPFLLLVIACAQPPAPETPDAPAAAAAPPVDEEPTPDPAPEPPPPSAGTAVDDEPFDIGGDVLRPEKISSPAHDELNALLHSGRFRWGGCILSSVVNRQGKIEQIELLKPDRVAPEIEAVLIRTLQAYRFKPATRNGEPVAVRYNLVIHHCPHWPREPDPPSN